MSASFDIVTVGGGLAGATLARRMAARGAGVLVVERERRFVDRVRGEVLQPWGVAEARALGIYELLRERCGRELRWLDMSFGGMQVDAPRSRRHHAAGGAVAQLLPPDDAGDVARRRGRGGRRGPARGTRAGRLGARGQQVLAWGLIVSAWGNMIASLIGPLFGGRGLTFGGGLANSLMYVLFLVVRHRPGGDVARRRRRVPSRVGRAQGGLTMQSDRARLLDVAAVLFAVLAISNFAKPFGMNAETGFVFFGRRLSGTPNAIIGPLFGLYLLIYAVGIWRRRRWAVPMGIAYACYVVVNLMLFTARDPNPANHGIAFNVVYGVVAIGVSAGTALVLARRRAALT